MQFFFALHESGSLIEAQEAHDAFDLKHAMAIVAEAARDIMSSDIKVGHLSLSGYIIVYDDRHIEVGRVLFSETVEII